MPDTAITATGSVSSPSLDFVSLSERLRIVEARQLAPAPKTAFERAGAWGGAIALVLSIATGTFTVYDSTIGKPQADREKKVERIETIVSSINAVVQEGSAKLSSMSDPVAIANLTSLYNAQILSLVRNAEAIEPEVRTELNASDYLTLGNAELQVGNYEGAKKYFASAIGKQTDPSTHAEILRLQGRVLGQSGISGDVEAARTAFAQSDTIMRTLTGFNAAAQRANLTSDRIITEFYMGDCQKGGEYIADFLAQTRAKYILPTALAALRTNLVQALGNQSRCPWDRTAFQAS